VVELEKAGLPGEKNRLLAGLPEAEYLRILPQLEPAALRFKQVLFDPDQPIEHVYFVRAGVGSVIATVNGADVIEAGLVGNEGFIGLPVLFGAESTPNRVIVQVEGEAWRLSASVFRRLVDESPLFRGACLRYAQYFNVQVTQSVACNRIHEVEERCARWLLMTVDRAGGTFDTTHEFLALMLGVRRPGVTVTMGKLQGEGLIRYSRGHVAVLDRAGLERVSCACYGLTRAALA